MYTINLSSIFQSLSRQQVPLAHTVPFLLRLQGVGITKVAREARVTRGFIYKVLAGERNNSKSVRDAITSALGFDPWEWE